MLLTIHVPVVGLCDFLELFRIYEIGKNLLPPRAGYLHYVIPGGPASQVSALCKFVIATHGTEVRFQFRDGNAGSLDLMESGDLTPESIGLASDDPRLVSADFFAS